MDSNLDKVNCYSGFSNFVFGSGGSCEVVIFRAAKIIKRGQQKLASLVGVNEGDDFRNER